MPSWDQPSFSPRSTEYALPLAPDPEEQILAKDAQQRMGTLAGRIDEWFAQHMGSLEAYYPGTGTDTVEKAPGLGGSWHRFTQGLMGVSGEYEHGSAQTTYLYDPYDPCRVVSIRRGLGPGEHTQFFGDDTVDIRGSIPVTTIHRALSFTPDGVPGRLYFYADSEQDGRVSPDNRAGLPVPPELHDEALRLVEAVTAGLTVDGAPHPDNDTSRTFMELYYKVLRQIGDAE